MIKARRLLQNFNALGLGCLLLGVLSGPALADYRDGPGPGSRQPLLPDADAASPKAKNSAAESASDGTAGARPGYTYLAGLGPGAHSIEIGQ